MGDDAERRDRLAGVEADLDGVERALARLDAGTYGECEVCGEPIGARLAADPVARRCLAHAGA